MSIEWVTNYIDKADFTNLFVEELGWERPNNSGRSAKIEADGIQLEVTEVASFRGVRIWACPSIPSGQVQRAVDKELLKKSAERVLIFHNENRQVWRWPQSRDSAGASTARLVSHEHEVGRPNEALRQRLQFIQIGLDEDSISVPEVVRRLRRAFDSDKVTKSFYKQFAQQYRDLTSVITGISVSDETTKPELRWYGSVLLNRLMFIYFMQRKGFLDGDVDYLRNRLEKIRELKRPGSFFEFYKDFLIPLFHEGLGADTKSRVITDPAIKALIGDIPYINGGLFSKHPLEEQNNIRVPDIAFENIFRFFDQWQWHLDDRPSGNPNEINPDVLGYIFEQFVNNREEVAKGNKSAATNADKGAYYTKEDVTGYMTANTLVPVFLDRLLSQTNVNLWRLLARDPERYIWTSVKHGCDQPLPDEIEAESKSWPRPSWDGLEVPVHLGIVGESWWEVVDRRSHFHNLVQLAKSGGITSTNFCVTNNLDMETLAIDLIDALDTPDDVSAAWQVLTDLRVIDPTCGSGAFLFAALNILHRLYSATFDAASTHAKTSKDEKLTTIVQAAEQHPNRDYFLLKHAALNNIYGVDLMNEAVEIARLRLFLKLISQVERAEDIEPLPDLEFNIRTGNVLVGALSAADLSGKVDLFNIDRLADLEVAADATAEAFRSFSLAQQAGLGHLEVLRAKIRLKELGDKTKNRLNEWWFQADKAVGTTDQYVRSHQPFHWFMEFPEVFNRGGFDVVVGNPPYVSPGKLNYKYSGFSTDSCPDIYAPCLERAANITAADGRLSMIVPLSLSATDDYKTCREMLSSRFSSSWSSTFGKRPSALFAGVQVRCTIFFGAQGGLGHHATTHQLWRSERRAFLFETLRFAHLPISLSGKRWHKIGNPELISVIEAISKLRTVGISASKQGEHSMWWKMVAAYWMPVAFEAAPTYELTGVAAEKSDVGSLGFSSEDSRDRAVALMAGKLGYLWWSIHGDDFHVTKSLVASFPAVIDINSEDEIQLLALALELKKAISGDLVWNLNAGKWVGNFDLRSHAAITDRIDELLLRAIGAENAIAALTVWHHQVMQATGDATGSHRGPLPPFKA